MAKNFFGQFLYSGTKSIKVPKLPKNDLSKVVLPAQWILVVPKLGGIVDISMLLLSVHTRSPPSFSEKNFVTINEICKKCLG